MRLTKEIVKNKLDDWFGIPYEMEILEQSDDRFIVSTVAESYNTDDREVSIIRIFVTFANTIELSEDFSYTVNTKSDSSLAACIGDCLKEYGKFVKRNN